jgi:PadR family transcriptional regulator, regulatory protein PadR
MAKQTDLLQGTLDLLILRTLSLQPLHGLGISERIHQISNGVFNVKPGSLFPALHRLEEQGWIAGEWGETDNHRRAKFYTLTKTGRQQLSTETRNWKKLIGAVANILEAT